MFRANGQGDLKGRKRKEAEVSLPERDSDICKSDLEDFGNLYVKSPNKAEFLH